MAVNREKLDEFEAGSLAKGVNSHTPDFSPELELDDTTVNVTSGILEGIGPRYGFSPIPGHMDQEAPTTIVTSVQYSCAGLMAAETGSNPASPASGYWGYGTATDQQDYYRKGIFGIFPFKMGGYDSNINVKDTYYLYLVSYLLSEQGNTPGTTLYLDCAFSSTTPYVFTGTTRVTAQSPLIYGPLGWPTLNGISNTTDLALCSQYVRSISAGADPKACYEAMVGLGTLASHPTWRVCATQFSVNGVQNPMQWMFGGATSVGDATHAPSLNFTFVSSGSLEITPTGFPPSFNYGVFSPTTRQCKVYALDDGAFNIDYSLTYAPTTSIYKPAYIALASIVQADFSATTATKITAATTYSDTNGGLLNDAQMLCDSSYQGILVAPGNNNAICYLVQDWYRSNTGTIPQAIDLIAMSNVPIPVFTYNEEGITTPTSFLSFPNFVRGTAMVTSASGIGLGAANSGILSKNTVYELGFSLFDKRLNTESNVCDPVKFQTGADDLVSLEIFTPTTPPETAYGMVAGGTNVIFPYLSGGTATISIPNSGVGRAINYMEYRLYYREEGMQEWLPALFIDAAKFWFYPHFDPPLAACTGGIGGLPGGRAGGFSDYSRLPQDNYTCVVVYKNRAFWLSDKSLCFSLANNMFAYPQRNRASCPIGSFKGAILQAYYGQASQDSRLVIFGTKETYVGKFTGNLLQTPVQVSVDTIANFDLDGSDFVIDSWTSVTAFSYRAACVAEGILYFWGPQGVFRDDGVNPLKRISIPLEPDIFGSYDPSTTDEIHCIYSDTTKEITWFYAPKTADNYATHAWVWNCVRETWLPQKYDGYIDAAQSLKIDTDIPTAGSRTVVFSRESATGTIQRAYFYDHVNRAGDIFPGQEMMVRTVTTPATGQRRLTLAKGYSSAFSSIVAGDKIALTQVGDYNTPMLTPSDFIGTVISTVAGTNPTIDISLPDGVTFDASVTVSLADHQYFFPIWHKAAAGNGINGFPYVIGSKYWIPGGMTYWANWLYLHQLYKLTELFPDAGPYTLSLGYRTPISAATATETITLADNSDGNCQRLLPLPPGDQNFEGQGISLTFSGIQIASAWVLQYLHLYAQYKDGMQMKLFESED